MIYLTSILHPAGGAIVMMHCEECRRFTIEFFAGIPVPPDDGVVWKMEYCLEKGHNSGPPRLSSGHILQGRRHGD